MNIYTIEADGVAVMVMSVADMGEVEEGITRHIGFQLMCHEHDETRKPLWSGKRDKIAIRAATAEERQIWTRSLRDEEEGDHFSWACYLVPVIDGVPDDDVED
jgi:hypothetical protein